MNSQEQFSSLINIVDRPSNVFVKGEGSWLIDREGTRYLDFIQGWAVNCLGHCPEEIVNAVNHQVSTLISASPAYYTDKMLDLAELIVKYSCFDQVFFANSGAEANEGAVKLARKWGMIHKKGAFEIITMDNSFHGRTLAMMSASGKPQWDDLFEPKVKGFKKVAINDINAISQAISDNTVAVMLEPIQGEAGVIQADTEYMQALRKLTQENNILLIVDEVQTGIGRTGKLFGYQLSEIEPDIMTLGKGIGGGAPLAALVAKAEICCFEPGDQGGTYNGNALMTAIGEAVIKKVSNPDFLADVQEKSAYLKNRLNSISKKYGHEGVRGEGLLLAFLLSSPCGNDIVGKAFDKKLLLNAPRPNLLRFMPALNVKKNEIDQMLEILESIITD